MKRNLHDLGNHQQIDQSITNMAKCLIQLSQANIPSIEAMNNNNNNLDMPSRVFECKTCNKKFPSFQALGGHRASHKKPRLSGRDGSTDAQSPSSPTKPKTHECSICGLEFAIGQALGGHMRRHRGSLNDQEHAANLSHDPPSSGQVIVKKSHNNRRVLLDLDLNLTPYENGLELFRVSGKTSSLIDCFY